MNYKENNEYICFFLFANKFTANVILLFTCAFFCIVSTYVKSENIITKKNIFEVVHSKSLDSRGIAFATARIVNFLEKGGIFSESDLNISWSVLNGYEVLHFKAENLKLLAERAENNILVLSKVKKNQINVNRGGFLSTSAVPLRFVLSVFENNCNVTTQYQAARKILLTMHQEDILSKSTCETFSWIFAAYNLELRQSNNNDEIVTIIDLSPR